MNAERAEKELIEETSIFLNDKLIDEIGRQGHHLTGALEKSIGYDVSGNIITSGNRIRVIGNMAGYGIFVNLGVKADRIPYGGGETATGVGSSKYIEGLKTFWMLKGLSEKEAMRAAFATANKQKKEGMPTIGSYQYSASGQRLRFIKVVEEKFGQQIDDKINSGLDSIIDILFHETKSEKI